MTCPVMYEDKSEARKRTQLATSSAVPPRFNGMASRHCFTVSSGNAAVISVSIKPGATALQRIVSRSQFKRHRFGETDDTRFGRGIIGLPRISFYSHHAADINNTTLPLFQHRPLAGLGNIKNRIQICFYHFVELIFRHSHQQSVAGNAWRCSPQYQARRNQPPLR